MWMRVIVGDRLFGLAVENGGERVWQTWSSQF